ncbi:MAG: tetratricopeptide repeat protein [Selenomonadaceae bacterium]|nr:tetratricopeptide repeat protein [Selenomonadaceae bacterium]
MKKFFSLVVALAIFLCGSTSFAGEQLIEATGDYIMDSRLDETFASATARAREDAKRAAVEKAGVYLQSYSKMVDLRFEVDEVQSVAASLLKIQDETQNVETMSGNLIKFTVTIKALVAEPNEADLKALMQNRQALDEMTRKYNELQEKYDALNQDMKKYRNEFDAADDTRKAEIKREVTLNSEKFSAVDELARGNEFAATGNRSQALAAYDKAIQLDSQLAEAYNNRGIVRYELGQFTEAIEDYSAAIRLKSNYADALNNRGNAYLTLEQFQNAETDLKAAVKLNENSATIHNNLGSVYMSQKKFDAALNEYTRALQLKPNFTEALYNRAITRYAKGDFAGALLDLSSAMKLNPADPSARELYDKLARKTN